MTLYASSCIDQKVYSVRSTATIGLAYINSDNVEVFMASVHHSI